MDDREENINVPSVYRDLQRNNQETAGKFSDEVFS